MLDLQELQILAQLVDNLDVLSKRLERAYGENSGENFSRAKQEILDIQKKIDSILVNENKK
jgi:hypothetical protein